jgi:Acetyltransferase (GNAT) domain
VKPPLSVRILPESEFPAWNDLVSGSEEGSVYHTPEYLDALCGAAGGGFRILAAERGGELQGGLALYERSAGAGSYVAPRLLLYYNGPVLRPLSTRYPSQQTARRNELLDALRTAVTARGYGRIQLRCRSPLTDVRVFLARGWTARPHYSYVVPLDDLPALRARMEQNLRRLVDRCASQGLTITEDDDFDGFFRLHAQIHDRKGAALYLQKTAFQRYFERIRALGLARLYHARLPDGTSVSTQLVLLGPHRVSHTVSAAADAAHLKLGATAYLRWGVFERLAALGSTANDLTDAALNPVTHFKAQLGGDLVLCLFLEAPESSSFRRQRRFDEIRGSLRRRAVGLSRRLFGAGKNRTA